MKEILKFSFILFLTYSLFYFIIAFLKWDINLFDEIARLIEARFLTIFLLVAGFGLSLNIYEITD